MWSSCCSAPPHLAGSTLAEIETLLVLKVSCDIFMNTHCSAHRCSGHISHNTLHSPTTPDCPPLTRGSQIQSSNDGETLMQNIWSVFRSQVSAKGGAKWNLANLLRIHLGRVVTSRGTTCTPCLHYYNGGLLCCSLSMNLSHLH